ncbi:HAD-IA family hydrolase [Candidatus Bathyarchaeota archaeon]|nr:HAD-IA family hydrolase [Candidatus Bathyarchaeota archaeon]
MNKFKVVLFDLGGTLVRTVEVQEIYRRILEVYGVQASSEEIAKAHKENEKEFDVKDMIRWKESFWVKWNARVLEKLGINENKEFLARKIDELWWNYAEVEIYSDVSKTLTQLKDKGVKMGIVTNAFEKDYQQILQKLAWTNYFDVAVGINACNKAKPDKAIFLYAVNKLCVCPEEAIFVGDSVKHDYEGAKKAGLKPLIIDREGKVLADVETIRSLDELLYYFKDG